MIGYVDLVKKLLVARSDALSGKRSLLIEQANNASEIDYFEKVLYGYGGVRGILGVMGTAYEAIRNSSGSVSSAPSYMHNVLSSVPLWRSKFTLAISLAGDGVGGFYVPEPTNSNIAVDVYNKNCDWVVTHGMSAESADTSSVFYMLDQVDSALGIAATETGNMRGPYGTLEDAQAAAATLASMGSGIFGARTRNIEVFGTAPPYTVGLDGTDDKDAYSGNGKTEFESAISQTIVALGIYRSAVLILQTALTESNSILSEAKVTRPADTSPLDTVVVNIDSMVAELQSMLDYFSPINTTSGSNRSQFNTNLNTVNDYITSYKTTIRGHISTFHSLIGASDSSNLRQGLSFWVKMLLAKPSGLWIERVAIADGLIQSGKEIVTADDNLSGVQGTELGLLEKPTIDSIYPDPLTDELGEVITERLTLEWAAPSCCNKYKVMRKKYTPGDVITNDEWASGYSEFWIVSVDSNSGEIETVLTQTPPDSDIYLYRVIGYDANAGTSSPLARMDSFDSNTPQSDILGTEYTPITSTPLKATFATGSDMTKVFSSGQLVLTNAGIKQIDEVAETIILFVEDESTTPISSIQKLMGAGKL